MSCFALVVSRIVHLVVPSVVSPIVPPMVCPSVFFFHLVVPLFVPLKYGSEEKGSSLCRCSILLGFIMSKKQERLRSELLSEDKITNLLGFLT